VLVVGIRIRPLRSGSARYKCTHGFARRNTPNRCPSGRREVSERVRSSKNVALEKTSEVVPNCGTAGKPNTNYQR